MSSELALSIDNLSKEFANETVLRDVSLDVETGEFCVIMGPSGSGKSTLLDSIAGLIEYQAADVRLSGSPAETVSVEQRDLGYVFQEFEDTLFPHKTVGENVVFGLRQQNGDLSESDIDDRVDEMLELLAISHTRHDLPTELSGGQQQRVEVARQLVRECDIMLLDDPLADLDYKLQKRMELEIRQIQEEMTSTFVYVTHNQDQALKLADKLVILNHGRIEQIGPPNDVYNDPETAFVGRFVGDSNTFVGEIAHDSDCGVTVETELGEMVARVQGDGFESGRRSITIVRPEDVAFGEGEIGKDNVYEGTLVGWTYMGKETEYTFELEGLDSTLNTVMDGTPTVSDADVGTTMSVGWDQDETLCFATLSTRPTETIDNLMEI